MPGDLDSEMDPGTRGVEPLCKDPSVHGMSRTLTACLLECAQAIGVGRGSNAILPAVIAKLIL